MAVANFTDPETGKRFFTCLSTDTKPSAFVGALLWETDTDIKYECYGDTNWKTLSTYGAALVRPMPGPQTQAHNRELIDVSTRQSCTWIASENITEVTITPSVAAGTVAIGDGVFVTFDATSDALADTWLTEASYTATDSNRYFVPVGSSRTFRFTSYITRIDAIIAADSGITAAHIIVEAN